MAKKTKPNQNDINTFREAVKGVRPLIHNKIRLNRSLPKKKLKKPIFEDSELDFQESPELPLVQANEFIFYNHSSISNKILRKLRKGQYNIDAALDLHGMIIDEAKTAVNTFLNQCLHEGVQVALIIHGKGLHSQMPILKNKLNQWLRNTPSVLAFCSAAPRHGSRGAIYVLLKT